jgi:SAM-dependent methyltransferase
MPEPLPGPELDARRAVWTTLQDNGARAYRAVPELNLSVGDRFDARAFGAFCRSAGRILDIGCGPQWRPSYVSTEADAVGIDPLLGRQPRGLPFVQGLGEYLPFRDRSFDQVLFATSLDHVLDPLRSLAEAARCLRDDGRLCIWLDGGSEVGGDSPRPLRVMARKALRSLASHDWLGTVGLVRTCTYVLRVACMPRPAGAVDCFHFQHVHPRLLEARLPELGLEVGDRHELPGAGGLFLALGKCRAPNSSR